MRYLFCLIPPVAVLLCGKPIQALINLGLTFCLYLPGLIHALIVVNKYYADQRTEKITDAIKASAAVQVAQQNRSE
jgi:uncharacterized membrane protein YqaE (UPF0057 family)